MNDDKCERNEFADGEVVGEYAGYGVDDALILRRVYDDKIPVRTNVPHLVVHHSPTGFEFGYGGSGPADLALNVCQWYLNSIGYSGQKSQCFDGNCWSLAFVLHQDFKRDFIENAPHDGTVISFPWIKDWFDMHITDDLKKMYVLMNQEEIE